ncbi:MAG: DUF2232 domain-containing protein [Candidatus Binataceae bacterium]
MTRKDALGMVRAGFTAAVLFLAGGVVPVLGGVLMIFAPAPVLGYAVGLPGALWRTAGAIALAAVLIGLGAGPLGALGYALTLGLATAVMAYMLERRKPFELIVMCTVATILVAGALAALAFVGSPAALAGILHHDLMTAMGRGEKFYKMLGMETGISTATRADIVEATIRLSPALAAISAAFTVLINLGVFWRLSGKQQRVGYMLFGDLVRWATPEWLIWMLLVTGFGMFVPVTALSTIFLDCFVCVAAVYFCQGLAIMAFYFKVLAMPPLARGLIYFVTVVQPVLAVLVCAAGIFDLWIDFRRLKPPSQEARNFGDFL